jgi:DNA-directed RNA polymerase subunit RPC12/RpoP
MKRLVLAVLVVGTVAVLSGRVPAAYVFGPLIGLLIWRIGTATFGSLREGASYIPDGPPVPVDPSRERIVYWCSGCGAEVLLLVRGTETAPRHCGEKMTERAEVARER